MRNFYTQDKDLIVPYLDQIKQTLYDSEPSVMSAALGLFAVVVKVHIPASNGHLTCRASLFPAERALTASVVFDE